MDMMTARRVSSNGMTPRLTSSGPLKILWGSAAHKRKYGSCPLLPRIFLDISVCHVCPSASGFGFIKNLFDPCGKLLWIVRIDQDGILAVNKIGLKARNARRHDGHVIKSAVRAIPLDCRTIFCRPADTDDGNAVSEMGCRIKQRIYPLPAVEMTDVENNARLARDVVQAIPESRIGDNLIEFGKVDAIRCYKHSIRRHTR